MKNKIVSLFKKEVKLWQILLVLVIISVILSIVFMVKINPTVMPVTILNEPIKDYIDLVPIRIC